jgi:hypothetical protein
MGRAVKSFTRTLRLLLPLVAIRIASAFCLRPNLCLMAFKTLRAVFGN